MQTLSARRLLTPIGQIEYPVVTLDADGFIADIESDPAATHDGSILAPAFLDIHTHGATGEDVMAATPSGFARLHGFLARHGVARYLPTTVTAPIDATLQALERIAEEIEREPAPGAALPVGIHLEGPFLSHVRRGVHTASELLRPDIGLFDRFQQAARGHIRLITLAPELPGALDLIRHAAALGIRVSVGHTDASAPETLAAIEAGAVSATHTYNAMRPIDHRAPGVLAAVLDSDRLFAELICDGVHVDPMLVRLWLKAKGPDRAILVTDAMAAAGMPDGRYLLGNLETVVANGRALLASNLAAGRETLAGSILTLDRAVANLQAFTGTDLATAVRCASANPARMLGLDLAPVPGASADFNRFSADGRLIETILRGKRAGGGPDAASR